MLQTTNTLDLHDREFPILDDKYILVKKIGSGATCKVKLSKPKDSDEIVAVKILTNTGGKALNTTSKHFIAEIEMLKKVNHENIINLKDGSKGVIKKPDGRSKIVDYIVLEYASNGELFDYLFFPRKGLGEKFSRYIFSQLIEGLDACHSSGVAHRDLKTENLMMDKDWILKIADFGYATLLAGKSGNGLLNTFLGTLSYAAPEILNKKSYVGSCADIFSCGVILFVLVTGKLPFGKAVVFDSYYKNFIRNDYEGFWNVMLPKIDKVSEEFKSIINLLLAYEPTQRPTITEIKNHPWLKGELPTKDEIFEEFEKRKLIVTKMKELEAAEEMKKKQGNRPGGVYRGENDFSNGMEEFFSGERKVDDWFESSSPYKIQINGHKDANSILNYIANYFNSHEKKNNIQPHESIAKFKVFYQNDENEELSDLEIENLSLEVQLKKVNENNHIIEFFKLGGDKNQFFEVFDEFVNYIEVKN